MSKHAYRLAFCLFVLVAPAVVPAQAEVVPVLTYTQSGVGATMDQACTNAAEKIKENCAVHGSITTDPGRCLPLNDAYVCTCEASTLFCGIIRPF